MKKIGAVYLWVAIIIVFSIVEPEEFPTTDTVKQILNSNALLGITALAVVVPLAAGVFDVSIGFTMALSAVVSSYLLVHTGIGLVGAIVLAMGAAMLVGVVNAVVVVQLRVESLIATLGTGSLVAAAITMLTGDVAVTGGELLEKPFADIAGADIGGFTLPVLYVLLLTGALWYVLERTATGRRLYATGFNEDAARLQGVKTSRLRFWALIVCAGLAGFAGILFASAFASGSSEAGEPYLLTSYAAAFLGATQLKAGRFNAWGTVIAVLMLGTGVTGLGLSAAPTWAADVFTGVVLIGALVITGGRISMLNKWKRVPRASGRRPNDKQRSSDAGA